MMFKIGTCGLCQRVYRTGGLRQLIQRDLSLGIDRDTAKKLTASKTKRTFFMESRIVVCTECYKKLEKGEGVDVYDVVGDMLDGDKIGKPDKNLMEEGYRDIARRQRSVMHEVTVDLANKAKEKSDAKLEKKQKKERKPRGKRVETKGSEMIKSLAECSFEGGDTDEKPKGKKQRKTRSDKGTKVGKNPDPLATEASESGKDSQAEKSLNAESEVIEDDVVIPTSMPSLKDTEPEIPSYEEVKNTPDSEIRDFLPVTNQDRKLYKEQVRQALSSSPEIMYSEIARKLNIDEGLVSQLANEIDGEA